MLCMMIGHILKSNNLYQIITYRKEKNKNGIFNSNIYSNIIYL